MRIAVIGNYASQSFLIGKELEKSSYDLTYFFQSNDFCDSPAKYKKLGNVQGPVSVNYFRTGMWIILGKFLKKFDIEMINGTYPKCVRSTHFCYYYHGSELRSGIVKPQIPSFISLRELQKYSKESVFLSRCADSEKFFSDKEVKEKKEEFKDKNGIDVIIGHFTPAPEIKGSDLILETISRIRKEEEISIHLINNPVSRDKMSEVLNYCDFILDHVNPDTGKTYNVITIEALMCGIPSGSYYTNEEIDFQEMKNQVTHLQFEKEELKETILGLIRKQPSINRNLVMKYHSPKIIAKKVTDFWEKWGFL